MYGRYREDLGEFAKSQANRIKGFRDNDKPNLMKKGLKRYQRALKRKFFGKFICDQYLIGKKFISFLRNYVSNSFCIIIIRLHCILLPKSH